MKKIIRSFGYAFKGLAYAYRNELNFRIHTFAAFLAVILGILLHLNSSEWLWVALSITIVMAAELLNTSIETLTDLVSPEYHEKAGHTKDVAAAGATIAAFFAIVVGLVIFLPKIISLLTNAA